MPGRWQESMLNKDFKDMLRSLLEADVEFLLIGAYALAAYGYPRATKDLDIWVRASETNAPRIRQALSRFGAPIDRLDPKDFSHEGTVLQIGVAPVRIDITTKVDGVAFEEAYAQRGTIDLEDLRIPIISRKDLIRNKKASGRPQDLVDAQMLEQSSDKS
jgi:hypothetical protein